MNSLNIASRLILALTLSASLTAQAGEVCDPIDATHCLTDAARNDDHSIREFVYGEAIKYCNSKGMAVPTALDLALYAQNRGAKGVVSTAYPGHAYIERVVQDEVSRMKNLNNFPITTINDHYSDMSFISFYFNSAGYRAPSGDLQEAAIWSSSWYLFADQAYAPYYFIEWSGEFGPGQMIGAASVTPGETLGTSTLAVRCVRQN